MAKTRSMMCGGGALLVLVLILCNEAVGVDGRLLKHGSCKRCHEKSSDNMMNLKKAGTGGTGKALSSTAKPIVETSKMEKVEDFRPTEPGHSPGVGHSLNN
ncbi:hypothetical protein RHGRI_023424 [Rhododendron griersonianum]|uniref:Uncharacterized protein n=1 Tax=Rhododendron griersonianum TaxID=479676 RepID=A0AAV6J5J8_9ERIC|nr:hypothetical protein RHGRI_023424 [Rhododendron griersonianum]